jgi:hypothetical protein
VTAHRSGTPRRSQSSRLRLPADAAARERGETTISFDPRYLDVLHIDGDFEGWYAENC